MSRPGRKSASFLVQEQAQTRSALFSPDGRNDPGRRRDDSILRLWDVQTGEEIREFTGHVYSNIFGLAYSPDGKTMVSGTFDKTARLWDIATGQQLREFDMPDGASAVAFSPDGKTILTGSWDGAVRLWDVQTGSLIRPFVGHTESSWSPFRPMVVTLLTGGNDFTARLWDITTGQEIRRFAGHSNAVETVAFSPRRPLC